jgi:hypothetical protein
MLILAGLASLMSDEMGLVTLVCRVYMYSAFDSIKVVGFRLVETSIRNLNSGGVWSPTLRGFISRIISRHLGICLLATAKYLRFLFFSIRPPRMISSVFFASNLSFSDQFVRHSSLVGSTIILFSFAFFPFGHDSCLSLKPGAWGVKWKRKKRKKFGCLVAFPAVQCGAGVGAIRSQLA